LLFVDSIKFFFGVKTTDMTSEAMNRAVIVTVVVITVHREVKVTVQTRTVEIAVIEHLTPVGTTTGQTIPVPVMVLPIRTTAVTETGELLRGYRNSAS
jgi:hypothetical protein